MIVRQMKKTDIAEVKALGLAVHMLHADARSDIFEQVNPFDEDYLKIAVESNGMLAVVCEVDGVVVGFSLAVLRETPKHDPVLKYRRIAHIEAMSVHSDYRGRGVGRALYNTTAKSAKASGANAVELTVWEFNDDARRFYESLGLTVQSTVMEERL